MSSEAWRRGNVPSAISAVTSPSLSFLTSRLSERVSEGMFYRHCENREAAGREGGGEESEQRIVGTGAAPDGHFEVFWPHERLLEGSEPQCSIFRCAQGEFNLLLWGH